MGTGDVANIIMAVTAVAGAILAILIKKKKR